MEWFAHKAIIITKSINMQKNVSEVELTKFVSSTT
jgi:hypothetical protein